MSEELEEYRKQKEMMDRIKCLPGRQFNMTLNQYIRYKKPKTVDDVQQIIDDWFITEHQQGVEILICHKPGPHYIGVKILLTRPNGTKVGYPPGEEVMEVERSYKLNGKKFTIIRRKNHDGNGSISGTHS